VNKTIPEKLLDNHFLSLIDCFRQTLCHYKTSSNGMWTVSKCSFQNLSGILELKQSITTELKNFRT